MLKKLVVAFAIMAIAAPAFAFVASKDGLTIHTPNNNPVDQPLGDRADVEYNTGGAMFFAPTTAGTATGWSFYIAHIYTNTAAQDLGLLELGFPTNEDSTDPIAVPVDWTVALNNSDIFSIADPYTYAWDGLGTFTPAGVIDTSPPDTYSVVDISAEGLILAAGASMIWGYENAGLCGQTDFNGEITYGLYMGFWDDDSLYGRTALQQFTGNYTTTASEDATLSQVKSLY
jgi:hypothetical protein